jgi:microcystin-dependent protein
MSEPFIAEIQIFAFDFPPRGWARCDGQVLPIAQNTALFALIGTTYGGNGITTFRLPDLRGRRALHRDAAFPQGQQAGSEQTTLTVDQLGPHTHDAVAQSAAGTSATPEGDVWARSGTTQYGSVAGATLDPEAIGLTGGGLPHDNLPPFLATNYCIALQGVFPSRSN